MKQAQYADDQRRAAEKDGGRVPVLLEVRPGGHQGDEEEQLRDGRHQVEEGRQDQHHHSEAVVAGGHGGSDQ